MLVEHCEVVEKEWAPEPTLKRGPRRTKHQPPSAVASEAAAAEQPTTPPGDPAPSAARAVASADAAIGLFRPSQSVCQLSSMEYKAIIDACGRACKAAKNAQRLSTAAAGAFAEEAAIFEDVQRYMTSKVEACEHESKRSRKI